MMKLPGDGSHLYTNPNICIMLRACECLFDNNIWLAHFWFRHFQIRMNYGHYNKRCKNPTSVLSESSNAVKIVGENECVYFQLESWHKPKIIHRLEFNWRLEAHGVALIEHIHCEIEGNFLGRVCRLLENSNLRFFLIQNSFVILAFFYQFFGCAT